MSISREEFFSGFVAETDELLRGAEVQLLELERAARERRPAAKQARELFRLLHTLKGLAAMVEAEPVVQLVHEMESVLRQADRSGAALPASAVPVLLDGLRAADERVRAIAQRREPAPAPRELLDALAALALDRPAAAVAVELPLPGELEAKLGPAERQELAHELAQGRRVVAVEFVPGPDKVAKGLTITEARSRLARLGTVVKVFPRTVTGPAGAAVVFTLLVTTGADDAAVAEAAWTTPDQVRSSAPPAPAAAGGDKGPEEPELPGRGVVRVEVRRLDDALERLSALIVTRFRLHRVAAEMRGRGLDVRDLAAVLVDADRQLRDLRAALMRTRMITVAQLLERVPLILRGLAHKTGKHVRLQVEAGRAELDKGVGDAVFPAIVHLLRNALDHGLEAPAERERLGKPREGQVRIACVEHSDAQLELVIQDDGRGVDAEAVAARAGRPVPRSAAELLELLALPGLSTAEAATETSGRGMGMDIVRRTVHRLGGELALETRRGAGTTFRLRVPLSVSIFDVFAFRCAEQTYVAPVAAIEEVVEVPAEVTRSTARGAMIQRRGRVTTIFDLAGVLGAGEASRRPRALVVRRDGDAVALAVDRVLGQHEVVVRPLDHPLVTVPGVVATTDLGDGRPTLVLDLATLAGRASAAPSRASDAS